MSIIGSDEDQMINAPKEDPRAYDYYPYSTNPQRLHRRQVMARGAAAFAGFLALLFCFIVQLVALAQLKLGEEGNDSESAQTYFLWTFKGVDDDSKEGIGMEMLPVQLFMVCGLIFSIAALVMGVMFIVCRVRHERQCNYADTEREIARQEYLDHIARVQMRRQRIIARGEDPDDPALELSSGSDISFASNSEEDAERMLNTESDDGEFSEDDRESSTAAYEEREPVEFYEAAERHRRRIDRNIGVVVLSFVVLLILSIFVAIISFALYFSAEISTSKEDSDEEASYNSGFIVMIFALIAGVVMGFFIAFRPFSGQNVFLTPVAPGQPSDDSEMLGDNLLGDHADDMMNLSGHNVLVGDSTTTRSNSVSMNSNPLVKKPKKADSEMPEEGTFVCNESDISDHDERTTNNQTQDGVPQ